MDIHAGHSCRTFMQDIQFPNAIQVGGRAYAVRGRGGAGGGHSSIEQKNIRHNFGYNCRSKRRPVDSNSREAREDRAPFPTIAPTPSMSATRCDEDLLFVRNRVVVVVVVCTAQTGA